jgi:hypothetical protein
MSRFVDDIRRERATKWLLGKVLPYDARQACPGWADHTCGVFVPKHRLGNAGGYAAYLQAARRRHVSLIR